MKFPEQREYYEAERNRIAGTIANNEGLAGKDYLERVKQILNDPAQVAVIDESSERKLTYPSHPDDLKSFQDHLMKWGAAKVSERGT